MAISSQHTKLSKGKNEEKAEELQETFGHMLDNSFSCVSGKFQSVIHYFTCDLKFWVKGGTCLFHEIDLNLWITHDVIQFKVFIPPITSEFWLTRHICKIIIWFPLIFLAQLFKAGLRLPKISAKSDLTPESLKRKFSIINFFLEFDYWMLYKEKQILNWPKKTFEQRNKAKVH